MTELKGKYYSLLGLGGLTVTKIKINFVKTEVTNSVNHPDGSFSPSFISTLVSENGAGWYRVYGGSLDKITSK